MSALLGDVDVTLLVDAKQIRDRLARADDADLRPVARTEDVDVGVGNEQRAGAEDRLELSRDVGLEDRAEEMTVADLAVLRLDGEELARGRVADEEIVDGEPRGAGRGDHAA